jgi:transcriptional regulator
MHPNRAFHWDDPDEILNFAREHAFAHVFAASPAGLFVVHVPVLVKGGRIWFHVAKRNRIADHLDGRPILISIAGREAYQSANWYVTENQVPTWHYESIEIEGPARRLSDDQLVELLDLLTDALDPREDAARQI